ncbi:KGK domain-containing protein [Nostoc sp.]|uniref:KGK domain-containing protein n=1 Tax=Nostoc sp. TaxID=1180 RepID=UPI002FF7EFD9
MNKECSLSDDDVITAVSTLGFGTHAILKFSELKASIAAWVKRMESTGTPEPQWFREQGFKCEVLRSQGGGWQKGRFMFRMEFIPDNPEAFFKNSSPEEEKPQSPLHDLRSQLDTQ